MFQLGQRAFGSEISNPRQSIDHSCLRTSGNGVSAHLHDRGLGVRGWFSSFIGAPPRRLDRTPLCPTTCTFGEGGGEERRQRPRDVVPAANQSTCFHVDLGARAIAIFRDRVCLARAKEADPSKKARGGGSTHLARKADGDGADGIHRIPLTHFPRGRPLKFIFPLRLSSGNGGQRTSHLSSFYAVPRCVLLAPHGPGAHVSQCVCEVCCGGQ